MDESPFILRIYIHIRSALICSVKASRSGRLFNFPLR